MDIVKLSAKDVNGSLLEASFAPSHGMNLLSYKKGDIEVIDLSTKTLFEERMAGLGAFIGPHFHRRPFGSIALLPDEKDFPHVKAILEKDRIDPLSHGIGRYTAWSYEVKDNEIKAILRGEDKVNDTHLKDIEGQDFTMRFFAKLDSEGLHLDLSVVSDTDSVVGLHTYYFLPENGAVFLKTQNYYLNSEGKRLPIQPSFSFNPSTHELMIRADQEVDAAFHAYPDPLKSEVLLDAIDWKVKIKSDCSSEENACQLYHPANASFFCIEPLSAQDPRHPNLSVSKIKVCISILS